MIAGSRFYKCAIAGTGNNSLSRYWSKYRHRTSFIFPLIAILFLFFSCPGSYAQPVNWTQTDIGDTGAAGTYDYNAGIYTIAGAGTGIGGTADSFSYVKVQATGNVEMITRVASQTNTSSYAVAGLMIRNSLAPDAQEAVVGVSPANGINFTYRQTVGGASNTILGPSVTAPVWLRLVKSGSNLAGYQSNDGISWSLVGNYQINLPNVYYVGFAVSSNSYGNLSTVVYDHATLMTSVPQRSSGLQLWLRSDVGVVSSGGSISQWTDQSGNGNNATQATGANKPTVVTDAVNGLPALNFNGTSQFLQMAPGFASFPNASIFVVTKPTFSSGTGTFIDFGNGGSNNDIRLEGIAPTTSKINIYAGISNSNVTWASGLTTNEHQLVEAIYQGTGAATLYRNGTQGTQGPVLIAPTVTRSLNFIGRHPAGSDFLTGQIAEILVYNSALTLSERVALESYIHSKYGIGSAPTLSPPTINPGNSVFFTAPQTVTITAPSSGAVIHYTTDGSEPTTASPVYTGPFEISSSTVVKAIAAGLFFVTSPVASSNIQIDPNTTNVTRAGLQLWLKADNGVTTSGSNVTQWADVSGNNNNAAQATGTNQPTLVPNAVNGLPALAFNGTAHYLQMGAGFANFPNATIFVVTKPVISSGTHTFIDFGNGGANNDIRFEGEAPTTTRINIYASISNSNVAWTSGLVNNQYQLLETVYLGSGTATLYRNGTQGTQGPVLIAPNITRTLNFIGRHPAGGNFLSGQIAEILVYNTTLTSSERASVESYLVSRYGIAVNAPKITPATGVYTTNQTVTMSADPGAQIRYTDDGSIPTINSPLYTGPIAIESSTVLKAIAVQPFGVSSVTTAFIQIDPNTAAVPRTNLLLWLKADWGVETSGSNVTQWTDMSGNNNHASQSNPSDQPTLVADAINNLPAINFNGTSQYFQMGPGFNNFSNAGAIFIVTRPAISSGTHTFIDLGNGGNNNDIRFEGVAPTTTRLHVYSSISNSNVSWTSGLVNSQYQLLEGVYQGTGSGTLYRNGIQGAQGSVLTMVDITRTQNFIGRFPGGGNFLSGRIAELLVFNGPFSSSQRAAVEGYLIGKYQPLTLSTTPQPVISVPGGTLNEPTQVAIAAKAGATIYYTTDGSTPTTGSPIYTGPINVYYSQTVKAIAVLNGVQSSVASETYTLDPERWTAPVPGDPVPLNINLELPTNAVPQ